MMINDAENSALCHNNKLHFKMNFVLLTTVRFYFSLV